jgi:hypothetical protein
MVTALNDGAVNLFYDNSPKLATTATGIDVTGTVTADGLTVDGDATIQNTGNSYRTFTIGANRSASVNTLGRLDYDWDGTPVARIHAISGTDATNKDNGDLVLSTSADGTLKQRIFIDQGGDISFYEDTGTTAKFFWDAGAERLGIGTSSPNGKFETYSNAGVGGSNYSALVVDQTSESGAAALSLTSLFTNTNNTNKEVAAIKLGTVTDGGATPSADIRFETISSNSLSERMRIDSSGNVGIGTDSPNTYSGYTTLTLDGTSGSLLDFEVNGTHTGEVYADGTTVFGIQAIGSRALNFKTNNLERMRIDSSGNVGIGTASPYTTLDLSGGTKNQVAIFRSTDATATIGFADNTTPLTANLSYVTMGAVGSSMVFNTNLNERMRIDSSGNVGIGTSSPDEKLEVVQGSGTTTRAVIGGGASAVLVVNGDRDNSGDSGEEDSALLLATDGVYDSSVNSGLGGYGFRVGVINDGGSTGLKFTEARNGSDLERMRIDSSGNLLVGTTDVDHYATSTNQGMSFRADFGGLIASTRSNNYSGVFNRIGTDGDILNFRKDGATVGSISSRLGTHIQIQSAGDTAGLHFGGAEINPVKNQAISDNTIDLGQASYRFDDIYATNGTIQTSDRNEKQDIAELTDAEQRVAVAAKGLLRKFRWRDAVAEKGDEARTHFGIIAQDLQAAFAAEGLDAGDYAMFISSTWTDEETGEERTRWRRTYTHGCSLQRITSVHHCSYLRRNNNGYYLHLDYSNIGTRNR